MGRGSNGRQVFFGLEFTHAKIPAAIVFKTSRRGKLIKWVDSYTPTIVGLPSGTKTMRERVGVQCPNGFMLRKDEIQNHMKKHKTSPNGGWQDGKFFTIMDHVISKYRHPTADVLLKKALIQNMPGVDYDAKLVNSKENGGAGDSGKPIISGGSSPEGSPAGPVVDGAIGPDAVVPGD